MTLPRQPRHRAGARRSQAERWREYERRKAEFLGRNKGASPQQFDEFIRHLAARLGL